MGFDVFDPQEDARKNRLRIHTFDGPSTEDMDLFKERIREQKKIEAKLFPIKRRRDEADNTAAGGAEGEGEGAEKAESKEDKDPMQKQRDELRALLFKREKLLLKLKELDEDKKEDAQGGKEKDTA